MFIVAVNINLNSDTSATWIQATLPISYGSIGICRAVQLTPSAFLPQLLYVYFEDVEDTRFRARLLVASNKESGT